MAIYKVYVDIYSMYELPAAWGEALRKFREDEEYREKENDGGDVWNAKIELKQVNFEDNFRRTNYECAFEITTGDFLERYKPKEQENNDQ